MATLAGNLFVPPPAGDAATAMLALDAQVAAAHKGGERCIPLDEFFTGMVQNVLKPNELVTHIDLPRPSGKTAYLKFGRRKLNAPAIVTAAVRVVTREDGVCTEARIALGAAADYPFRAKQAEATLVGRKLEARSIADAAEFAQQEARPFNDALASEWYRRKMVGVFVKRALEKASGVEA